MCLLMGVLRSGFYRYRRNIRNKPIHPEHQDMLGFVKEIAEKSTYTYGNRRMQKALNALGYPVGRRKTHSLMKEAIETCKQHKVDVFSWLKYLLANIHKAKTVEQLEKLLPYNINPELLSDMRSIPELIVPEKNGVN